MSMLKAGTGMCQQALDPQSCRRGSRGHLRTRSCRGELLIVIRDAGTAMSQCAQVPGFPAHECPEVPHFNTCDCGCVFIHIPGHRGASRPLRLDVSEKSSRLLSPASQASTASWLTCSSEIQNCMAGQKDCCCTSQPLCCVRLRTMKTSKGVSLARCIKPAAQAPLCSCLPPMFYARSCEVMERKALLYFAAYKHMMAVNVAQE